MNAHDPELAGAVAEIPPIIDFESFEKETTELMRGPFKSRFGALFLDQLDDQSEEFEFLIDGLLSAGDKSVIGGPSQSGKSFLAIHAGMCIATGRDFFGAKVKPGLVVYQAGEGARGVKKRLRAWRKHHEVVYSRQTPFVLLRSPIDIYRPDGDTTPLIEEIKTISAMYDFPLRMVVIDTLATASGGADENASRDMGMVMANIARINESTGAHVSLVHHMNSGGTKLRGSTAIYANVDQVILVTRNETTKVRTAVLDKQKDEESGSRFQFELKSINLGATPEGKAITSCVCLAVGEKDAIRKSEEAKGFVLNAGEVVFMQALFAAEKKHGRAIPPDWNLPADVRSIVAYEDLKRAYVELSPSDALPIEAETDEEEAAAAKARYRDSLKKRLARAREALCRFRIIGVKGQDMWWTGRALRAFPQTLPDDDLPPLDMGDGSVSDVPF